MFLSSRIATSTTTCRLQDRRHCFPVLDWSGTWLPGRGLSACRRRQRSPTSISRHSDLSLRTSNVFGDRCFAAASPRLRNLLPINLRQCHSLEQFKRLLKTFLIIVRETTTPYIAVYRLNLLTYLLS